MMHTVRSNSARRLTAASVALALAVAALPLMASQAFAGKPVPFIGGKWEICVGAILDRGEVHGAQFDLSSNKGRWLFAEAQFKVGDAPTWTSYFPGTPTRVETEVLVMRREDVGPDESSSFRLRLTDRKGQVLTDGWAEVLDVDC